MSERLTVDTINSDQLDALYDRLATAEKEADDSVAAATRLVGLVGTRAERAEAALARVRAAHERITNAPAHVDAIWCLDQLDAALAEPKEG